MPPQPTIDLSSLWASLGQSSAPPPDLSSSTSQQTSPAPAPAPNAWFTIPAQQQPVWYPGMQMPSIINVPQPPGQQSSPNINVTINDKAWTWSISLNTNAEPQDFTIVSVLVSLVFISAWAIILWEQLDLIQISYMNIDMIQVSALLVILGGCLLLFKRFRVIRLLWSLMFLGSLAWVISLAFFASFGPDSSLTASRMVNIDAAPSSTDLWSIQFDSIISDISMRASTGQEWLRWTVKSDRPISISVSTGIVRYHEYPDRNPVQSISSSYELIHGFLPIDHLGVKQFYGSTNLDLSQANIKNITLASSIAEHTINIGEGMSGSTIDIMGWRVDTSVNIPKQMWLKLEYLPTRWKRLWGIDLENMSAQSDESMRVSSNYATAESKITVRIHLIGWSVKVRRN